MTPSEWYDDIRQSLDYGGGGHTFLVLGYDTVSGPDAGKYLLIHDTWEEYGTVRRLKVVEDSPRYVPQSDPTALDAWRESAADSRRKR